MAYSLPSMLATYTVPSGPSAGDDLSEGPVCTVHWTSPSGLMREQPTQCR